MDLPEYHGIWCDALVGALRTPQVPPITAQDRLAEFDIATIGARWRELLNTLGPETSSVPLMIRRIVNRVGRPLGINPFPRAFEYDLAAAEQKAQAFDTIYDANLWGSSDSRSGVGSELEATARYRAGLAQLIQQRGLTSMFDAPCGDLHWMPTLLKQVAIAYSGGDISSSVVAELAARHPGLSIRQFDICRDTFPRADVWHCRDCLFHLPFSDIRLALENFVASDIPYALLTTHRARFLHRNLDLKGIGFRFLDLERAPFSLPRPLTYVADYRRGSDFPRYVSLWSRAMIADALAKMGPR